MNARKSPLSGFLLSLALFASFSAAGRAEAKSEETFFPAIEGWTQGDPNSYGSDNLYMPIDGAADLFLRYNFEEMKSVEYTNGADSFTVEAYRHATPLDAFGIYSQGRPTRDIYLDLGVQGYAEPDTLNFLAGRHYVEMRAATVSEKCQAAMKAVAGLMAAKLNDGASFPAFFALFPGEGRKARTEKYVSQDILGYAFFRNAFQVDYERDGKSYTLFAMRAADEAGAASMLKAYLHEQKKPEETKAGAYLEVEDRFHGKTGFLLAGRHLLCVHGGLSSLEMQSALETLRTKILQDR